MDNKQYQGLRDTLHDALEETILDLDYRSQERLSITNNQINAIDKKVDKLVKLLSELL